MTNVLKYFKNSYLSLISPNNIFIKSRFNRHDLRYLIQAKNINTDIKYNEISKKYVPIDVYSNTIMSNKKILPSSIISLLIRETNLYDTANYSLTMNNKNNDMYKDTWYYPIMFNNKINSKYNELTVMDSVNGDIVNYNYIYSPFKNRLYVNDIKLITKNKVYNYDDIKYQIDDNIGKRLSNDHIYIKSSDELSTKFNMQFYILKLKEIILTIIVGSSFGFISVSLAKYLLFTLF